MRHYFCLQYHVQRHNPDDSNDKFTAAEQQREEALTRVRHLSAIFSLLKLTDIESRYTSKPIVTDRLETVSDAISNIGDLGQAIADGLDGTIYELFELYEQQAAFAENVTSIMIDEEA